MKTPWRGNPMRPGPGSAADGRNACSGRDRLGSVDGSQEAAAHRIVGCYKISR